MNKKIFHILLTIWIILWINFIVRDLLKRGDLQDYRALVTKDAEGKHAHTYGEQFYKFLKFIKREIRENKSYKLVGVENLSLAHRRAVYFLYPALEKESPDYVAYYNDRRRGTGLLSVNTGRFHGID
ncbi:MAG: hypothetical protein NG740_05640 [Omnitrophica bacterium]|nr:hypothetical protein [Candidatus Omnitrophota bacterium]